MRSPSANQLTHWHQQIDEYTGGSGEATTAAGCLARYIRASSNLSPWVEEAKGIDGLAAALKIRISGYRDKRSGFTRYGALVTPNLHYCPIQRVMHEGTGAFMLVDARYGRVRIKCLAARCQGREMRPAIALLPESLDLVFPKLRSRGRQRCKDQKRARDQETKKSSLPGPAAKRPRSDPKPSLPA